MEFVLKTLYELLGEQLGCELEVMINAKVES